MRKLLKRAGYTLLILFVLVNILMAMQAYHATRFYDNVTIPKKNVKEMSFGEKANAVLFGIQVPKRKVVDTLHLPHENVSLATEDGMKLASWYCGNTLDDTIVSKGTVIMFHGHASNRDGIISEAEAFYRMGYKIMMVDFRAHGNSEGNVCTIGYNETKDVKAACDYIAAKGERQVVLYGISLGASTIVKALHDYPLIQPKAIIIEMPFGSLYAAVKGTMRNNHVPLQPASALLTFWGGAEHGFWPFSMNPQDYAKDIHCPVLLQRGANDIRVTEEETQAIYKNLASTNKTLVEYTDCGHQSLYKKDTARWLAAVNALLKK